MTGVAARRVEVARPHDRGAEATLAELLEGHVGRERRRLGHGADARELGATRAHDRGVARAVLPSRDVHPHRAVAREHRLVHRALLGEASRLTAREGDLPHVHLGGVRAAADEHAPVGLVHREQGLVAEALGRERADERAVSRAELEAVVALALARPEELRAAREEARHVLIEVEPGRVGLREDGARRER